PPARERLGDQTLRAVLLTEGVMTMPRLVMRLVMSFVLVATMASTAHAAPLKVGYSDWPGFTAWEIAKVKGLFKKHGVDVNLVWFPVYTDSLSALHTGQLD